MKKFSQLSLLALFTLSVTFIACKKELNSSDNRDEINSQSSFKSFKGNNNDPEGIIFYALRDGNVLDKYSTSNPETVLSSTTISGIGGTTILAIDFRPRTGVLYGLGANDRIYTIDPATGATTVIPPLVTTAGMPVTIEGSQFGFDFNPSADRLRIISNTGQSLRINVETGVTVIDGSIKPQPATVTGAAYDNNVSVTGTGTELYVIDVLSQNLFEVSPANSGTLVEVGSLKQKVVGEGGFDIAPRNLVVTTDIGLGLYEVNKKSTLFRIDVETGETKILAKYKKDVMYTGIAISPLR